MSYGYGNFPTRATMDAQQRSANESNTRRTAAAAEATSERLEQLVEAMQTQLELVRQSQADAERSERFTRIMAWSSLAVAIASLAAAVVAIVVSAVPA